MTATSRGSLALALLALLTAGGCGGAAVGRHAPAARSAAAFSWLRPRAPAGGWRLARAAGGAALPYPRSWQPIHGDRDSASAALRDSHGGYLGYLNLTPRQGGERTAGWASFRARHNRAEGNRDVRVVASAGHLRFRTGSGACVQDSYTTSIGVRYMEIACLIEGRHPYVIVGASPPGEWAARSADIERAISGAEPAVPSKR